MTSNNNKKPTTTTTNNKRPLETSSDEDESQDKLTFTQCLESPRINRKIQGLHMMDELIMKSMQNNEIKRFSDLLKMMIIKQCCAQGIEESDTLELLQLSIQVLGHLTKEAGLLSREMVKDLINIYTIDLIHSSKCEMKRLAGVWIIKQLILDVPRLLNRHLTKVISELWSAILDPKLAVREGGIEALRECLNLIVRNYKLHEPSELFGDIYHKAMQQIQRNNARENDIHGSLLTFGELLLDDEYMMDKYAKFATSRNPMLYPGIGGSRDCYKVIGVQPNGVRAYLSKLLIRLLPRNATNAISTQALLFLKESDSICVRLAVYELLPKLAKFNPDAFSQCFLKESISALDILIKGLDGEVRRERQLAFQVLLRLSKRFPDQVLPHLLNALKEKGKHAMLQHLIGDYVSIAEIAKKQKMTGMRGKRRVSVGSAVGKFSKNNK